jgi:hypothetical protein
MKGILLLAVLISLILPLRKWPFPGHPSSRAGIQKPFGHAAKPGADQYNGSFTISAP